MNYHLSSIKRSYVHHLNEDDLTVIVENEIISHGFMNVIQNIVMNHSKNDDLEPFEYNKEDKEMVVNIHSLNRCFYLITDEEDKEHHHLYNLMVLHYMICEMINNIVLANTRLNDVYDMDLKRILSLQNRFEDEERRFDLLESRYPELYKPFDRYVKVTAYYDTLKEFKVYEKDEAFREFQKNYGKILLNGYGKSYPLQEYFSQYSNFEGKLYLKKFPWYKKDTTELLSSTSYIPLERRVVLGMPLDINDKRFLRSRVQ